MDDTLHTTTPLTDGRETPLAPHKANTEAGPQIGFGNRIRRSPYFEATLRWGAKSFNTYNHVFMPLIYEGFEEDFWHLVTGVTLWDVAGERQVQVQGPDASRFAQFLTPRNLSKCAVGQCKYVLMCDENGGILNDPVLLRVAEDTYWFSLADSDALLWAKALAWAKGFDVAVTEPDVSPLQLQGPKSLDVMKLLVGPEIEDLKYFHLIHTEIGGTPVVVSRTGWSSERGYEIYLQDYAMGDQLWELIMRTGEAFGIKPAAPNTIRRIEGAMLSLGADMGLNENPFELGLGRLVDLDSDIDYVGKEALRRIRDEGVSRKMVGIELGGDPMPGPNGVTWPLLTPAGERIGHMTSGVHSPRLLKNIGLAIVDSAYAEIGTALVCSDPAGDRPVTVVETPFYDPKKALAAAE
jgi:glycine cleavage system aminomethyltransferase T